MRLREGPYTENTRELEFLAILEKLKKFSNNGKGCGAVLVDLSKASYCLDCELLIAKLKTFSLASSN